MQGFNRQRASSETWHPSSARRNSSRISNRSKLTITDHRLPCLLAAGSLLKQFTVSPRCFSPSVACYAEKEPKMRIADIQGVGPAYADKLGKVGIGTTDALLREGATPDGRKKIAESAGVSHDLI